MNSSCWCKFCHGKGMLAGKSSHLPMRETPIAPPFKVIHGVLDDGKSLFDSYCAPDVSFFMDLPTLRHFCFHWFHFSFSLRKRANLKYELV
ncbi:hypothetical protein ABKN59_005738 [Abortiporus biennis]